MSASPAQPPTPPDTYSFPREWGPTLSKVMGPPSGALAMWLIYTADHRIAVFVTIVSFLLIQRRLDPIFGDRWSQDTRFWIRAVVNFLAMGVLAVAAGPSAPAWVMAVPMVTGAAFAHTTAWLVIMGGAPLLGYLLGGTWVGVPWPAMTTGVLALTMVLIVMGRLFGLLQVAVTRTRRQQSQIVAVNDELEAALAARKAFLATMSHEIRTPMNGVLGMAELLDDSRLSADQRRMVGVIRSSGHGLLQILNDILDLSKLEAGRMVREAVPYRPGPLVEDVVELLRHGDLSAGVTLSAQLDLPEDAVLVGDPARLRQVLLNLVGNAVKFTRQGRIDVQVRWSGGRLACAVVDTGPGIAADVQTRLFEPFEQADASTGRRHGGTGLGLAISRRLVTLMGGELGLDSTLGEGSTFHFTVDAPAHTGDCLPVAPALPSDEEIRAAARVLLVDDNPVNLTVARAMLDRFGCNVTAARSGDEALALWEDGSFDLVFMDVQMPGMDGLEATRQLRAQGATVPVLALTAGVTQEERGLCRTAGMDAIVAKPITLDGMRDALQRWTGTDGRWSAPS